MSSLHIYASCVYAMMCMTQALRNVLVVLISLSYRNHDAIQMLYYYYYYYHHHHYHTDMRS